MKRISVILLVIVSLFTFGSCNLNKYVAYYGYFQNEAFILVYSSDKDTLYEISIPIEAISKWGRTQNNATIPDAMRSLANLEESGFMLGTEQTFEAIKEILNAMSGAANPTKEDRLKVISERSADFSSPALLSKMNALCGTDMSSLVNILKRTNAEVGFLDASGIVNTNSTEINQKYFEKFLKQVIYK